MGDNKKTIVFFQSGVGVMDNKELDEMGDHPTFPQESPAMQYVVHQVSMMHDAASCSRGYYKAHDKLIKITGRINDELNDLKNRLNALDASIGILANHTDSRKIAEYFKKSLDEAVSEIGIDAQKKARSVLVEQTSRISETAKRMEKIVSDIDGALSKLNKENVSTRVDIQSVCDNTIQTQETILKGFNDKIGGILLAQETLVSQSADIQIKLGKDIHASDRILFLIIFISIAAGITIGELIRFGLGVL
jgi:hypothetical protein